MSLLAACSTTLGPRPGADLDAPDSLDGSVRRDTALDARTRDDTPIAVCVGATCDAGDVCDACATDCGACAACGDGTCGGGETCADCPGDCGACPPACGNAACEPGETCADCPADCGACPPACGNAACEPGETCGSCPGDCGACPPTCGNGSCDAGETCGVCLGDCRVACPSPPAGFGVGGGLAAIPTCAFPLEDTGTWGSRGAVITALSGVLPVRTVANVLGDLNRTGTRVTSVPGLGSVTSGVRWETGDENVTYWIPQGITGSGDAALGTVAGRRVVLVSWYYEGAAPDKGVRIAVLDVTTIASPTYRFALLVEPYMNGTRPDFRAVHIHAGGLVWYGDLLYVPDTGNGFRVFDMAHMFEVATTSDTIGYSGGSYYAYQYRYVIPQVGAYQDVSSCSPAFSFAALDRASTPASIVSGEYVAGSPVGRLFRWPLDPASGRLAGSPYVIPTEAFYAGQNNIQGAVPAYGNWLLSSSAPAGGAGALYRVAPGASRTFNWNDSPEDLYLDASTGQLWSLSEALGARFVFSVPAANYR